MPRAAGALGDEDDDAETEVEEEEEEDEGPVPIKVGDKFYCTLSKRWWSVKRANKKWPKIEVWLSLSRIDVPAPPPRSTHSHSCLCPPRTSMVTITVITTSRN